MIRLLRLLIAGGMLLSVHAMPAWGQEAEATAELPRYITVTGSGEIQIVPDLVHVSLGIENQDRDLQAAREENARRTREVLAVAGKFGIPEHRTRTAHLRIEPRYSHKNQELQDYFVRRAVDLAMDDLSQFEALLAALVEAGVVKVHGLKFDHSQIDVQRAEARLLAVRNARDKAEALADELDQMIGAPMEITEGVRPMPLGRGAVPAAMDTSAQTLAPGLITVGARVTVRFKMLDVE